MKKNSLPHQEKERGAILALVAISLTAIVLVAAMAIDIGVWYVHQDHLRHVAEAASLAGAAQMPNETNALAAAQLVMKQNGIDTASLPAGFSYTASSPDHKYSYTVTITDSSYPTFLSSIALGKKVSITGKSTSTVGRPVALGSPFNHAGTNNFYGAPGSANSDGAWSSIDGYCSAKEYGDQLATRYDFNVYNSPTGQSYQGCSAAQLNTAAKRALFVAGHQNNGMFDNLSYLNSTDPTHSFYYVVQMPKTNLGGPNYNLFAYSPAASYEDPYFMSKLGGANNFAGAGQGLIDNDAAASLGYCNAIKAPTQAYTTAAHPAGESSTRLWPSQHDASYGTANYGYDAAHRSSTGPIAGHHYCLSAGTQTDLTGEDEGGFGQCAADLWPTTAAAPGPGDGTCYINTGTSGCGFTCQQYTFEASVTTKFTVYDVTGPLSSPSLTQHYNGGTPCVETYNTRSGPHSNGGNGYTLDSPSLTGAPAALSPLRATWDNLCTIPWSSNAVYILGVNTTANEPLSTNFNSFALLLQDSGASSTATCDSRTAPDTCARIYSKDYLHLKFSVPSGSGCPNDLTDFPGPGYCGEFPLAEFGKEYAGRQVQLSGWDAGDQMTNLQLLLPNGTVMPNTATWQMTCKEAVDSNVDTPASWINCPMVGSNVDVDLCSHTPSTDATYSPAGSANPWASNRKYIQITLTMDPSYDPAVQYANKDWFFLRIGKKNTCAGANGSSDTTTWSLKVIGTPIRVSS